MFAGGAAHRYVLPLTRAKESKLSQNPRCPTQVHMAISIHVMHLGRKSLYVNYWIGTLNFNVMVPIKRGITVKLNFYGQKITVVVISNFRIGCFLGL